jgi:RNA polymerase sigma factor (sigma-70 family)
MASTGAIEKAFQQGERRLWAIAYRLTGVAADADEIVQDAFARALEDERTLDGDDLERWLVRVTTNLSLDRLRRRKRRTYVGSWLPSPLESFDAAEPAEESAASRYERADSVSYAWLLALETLGARSRAALVLADVFEYPAAEVARILGTTEGNVRVLHHRARRALEGVDAQTEVSSAARARQGEALTRFLACMMQQDVAGMEALLAADVRSTTDAAGRYTALREPLTGRERVARFHLETGRRRAPISTTEIRIVNGAPALVIATRPLRAQMAPQLVLRLELDGNGLIREIQTVLAPGKLTAIRFPEAPAVSAVAAKDTAAEKADGGEESFEVTPTVRRL